MQLEHGFTATRQAEPPPVDRQAGFADGLRKASINLETNRNRRGTSTESPGRPKRSRGAAVGLILAFLVSMAVGAVVALPGSADAHPPWDNTRCPHFYYYQHGAGGIYTTAGVNFQPDDNCNGRHVRQAWVRVYQTGPAWRCQPHSDTGRRYTGQSSNPHTEIWHWAHVSNVKDSVTPGCTLKAHYGYFYY